MPLATRPLPTTNTLNQPNHPMYLTPAVNTSYTTATLKVPVQKSKSDAGAM